MPAKGFISVKTTIDTASRYLNDVQRKQLPFAIATAINETNKGVALDLVADMRTVFDRPTRWTLQGIGIRYAKKTNLSGLVFLKDFGGKGVAAEKFLFAQVEGGARRLKRSEVALQRKGILPAGYFTVPSRTAPKDAYGNIQPGVITKILSDLGAFSEVGYTANRVTKAAARASGGARKYRRNSRYFYVKPGQDKQAGIYELTGGGSINLLLLFVRAPRYRPRFKFYDLSDKHARARFPGEFNRALIGALKTAK